MLDNWHNNDGIVTGVAEPMNIKLSYRRLLQAEADENLKLNVAAQLKAKAIDLDATAGWSLADINTRVTATLPALGFGVTNWWTMAVAVPIVYTSIRSSTSFAGTTELQELVNGFAQKSRSMTETVRRKLNDVIATELESKGYLPLKDEDRTEVGDVSLVSKILVSNGVSLRWGIMNILTAPTGRTRAANRLIDPAAGDGQWDLATNSILEIPITGRVTFVHQLGHQVQFADHIEARIPISESERLSRDLDERAYRDQGDITHTQLTALFQPNELVTLGAGYYAAYKQRDYWSGSLASQGRYNVLGIETEQFMQAAVVNFGYSTVSLYRQQTFAVPLSFNFYFSKVFDGRNVRNADLWSANVSLYF